MVGPLRRPYFFHLNQTLGLFLSIPTTPTFHHTGAHHTDYLPLYHNYFHSLSTLYPPRPPVTNKFIFEFSNLNFGFHTKFPPSFSTTPPPLAHPPPSTSFSSTSPAIPSAPTTTLPLFSFARTDNL